MSDLVSGAKLVYVVLLQKIINVKVLEDIKNVILGLEFADLDLSILEEYFIVFLDFYVF